MPVISTFGAMSARGLGFGASQGGLKVQDVFDIDLWTGNGTSQSISTPFGPNMAWIKERSSTENHALFDTTRGATNYLSSNTTTAQTTAAQSLTAFSGSGYALGTGDSLVNTSAQTYVGWAFKEAPKFFDVVTWTGNGVAGRTIPHSLGVAPGMILAKATASASLNDWMVQHIALGGTKNLKLNTTAAEQTSVSGWNNTSATSTDFTVYSNLNDSGVLYVAYLFAHDTSPTGIIQCGSFTTDGSGNATVTLGWEPQWVLIKRSSDTSNWFMLDQTRGWAGSNDQYLRANTNFAEVNSNIGAATSTGFTVTGIFASSDTYVYMAIRRGPM